MKLYYVTLNSKEEAIKVSYDLLDKKLAVCTNDFPINCLYRYEGEIKEGAETVLIIKTLENMREKIESTLLENINYTHFIAELDVQSVNNSFMQWLLLEMNGSKD
jgi:periplasmic divalent cation tolerance protein